MSLENLKHKLSSYCATQGITEMKVAAVEALRDAPPLFDGVRGLLPEAGSAISFVRPFPKGALHLMRNDPARGLPFYSRMGALGARAIDTAEIDISMLLESKGWLAIPVFICVPMESRGRLDLWGSTSQIDLAARAGLGWIGKNGLLTTPGHGPRVGIGTVLTDAPLAPDTPLPQGCPDDCAECVDHCPAKAIDGSGRVNRPTCTVTQAITPLSLMMAKEFSMKDHAAMVINVGGVDEHVWYRCNQCVVRCPIGV